MRFSRMSSPKADEEATVLHRVARKNYSLEVVIMVGHNESVYSFR